MELIRGAVPAEFEVGVNGYGYGDGYGDGSGSGYGYGDGSGYGSGDGSGYGYGYGDGSGDGSGYGYGSGYGSGDESLVRAAAAQLPARFETDERTFGLWKSNADGRPANGGIEVRPAIPGLKQEAVGPLELCTPHCLHATLKPSKWKGERLWIVALEGEVVGDAEKMGALKREIICEVNLGPPPQHPHEGT